MPRQLDGLHWGRASARAWPPEAATREELVACLEHLVADADSLMTRELRQTVCDHAAGNYRILVSLAAELLMTAAQREITTLDEKLYLQAFGRPDTNTSRPVAARYLQGAERR